MHRQNTKKQRFIFKNKEGRCAQCEKRTRRYDTLNEEYICERCQRNHNRK